MQYSALKTSTSFDFIDTIQLDKKGNYKLNWFHLVVKVVEQLTVNGTQLLRSKVCCLRVVLTLNNTNIGLIWWII